jgi:hypothetical protein
MRVVSSQSPRSCTHSCFAVSGRWGRVRVRCRDACVGILVSKYINSLLALPEDLICSELRASFLWSCDSDDIRGTLTVLQYYSLRRLIQKMHVAAALHQSHIVYSAYRYRYHISLLRSTICRYVDMTGTMIAYLIVINSCG